MGWVCAVRAPSTCTGWGHNVHAGAVGHCNHAAVAPIDPGHFPVPANGFQADNHNPQHYYYVVPFGYVLLSCC